MGQLPVVFRMTVMLCFGFFLAVVLNAANSLPRQDDVSIVGGDEVDITEYPYQVLLLYDGLPGCGGSIISDQYILTAAHCMPLDTEDFTVRIGSTYVDKGGQEYKIKNKFPHPKYRLGRYDYDFAVLQVAEKMSINNKTTRIVKMADAGSSLNPGDKVIVTGWGDIQEHGPDSNVLKAVAVPVVSRERCQKAYGVDKITERMLCAGLLREGGKDACQGDSGGPAVSESELVQYGIVSWGHGCARPGYPGIYSNIPAARDWIKEVSGV